MSQSPRCSRVWQAEAIEDGRLQGSERDTFARHAAQCGDCTRELAALSRLRELGSSLETRESTDLERRRLRQNLLRRADDAMVGGERRLGGLFPSGGVARWASVCGVIACALVAVLWTVRQPEGPSVAPPAARVHDAPRFDIVATDGGAFRVERPGANLLVGVDPGSYSVHVEKLTSAQRFVMRLPDGELEVHGTRFVVVVGPADTRSVAVSEGLVALRIRGNHELLLHPGDAWSAPIPAAPAVAGAAHATPEASALAGSPHTQQKRLPVAVPSSASSALKPDAGAAFSRAMSAYSRGDFAESERLFLAFEREFPKDARTEDSAFLRVTARTRRGDSEGAKVLAKEYLRRFPAGLRRVEAERLGR